MRFGGPVVPLVSMRDRDAGRGRPTAGATAGDSDRDRRAERTELTARAVGGSASGGTNARSSGAPSEQRELEAGHVGAQPFGAEHRVDRDHARTGAQQVRAACRARPGGCAA